MTDPIVPLLRRYVERRAAVKPAEEWGYWTLALVPGMATLVRVATEREARERQHWQRLRIDGMPWCPWLGRHTAIADDLPLQAFFLGIGDGEWEWRKLALAARRRPAVCLREWREAGQHLIATTRATAEGSPITGRLRGWPNSRGTGARSLLTPR